MFEYIFTQFLKTVQPIFGDLLFTSYLKACLHFEDIFTQYLTPGLWHHLKKRCDFFLINQNGSNYPRWMKNSKWLDENDSEQWKLFPNGSKLTIIAQKFRVI